MYIKQTFWLSGSWLKQKSKDTVHDYQHDSCLKAKFCHNDDLKCIQETLSALCDVSLWPMRLWFKSCNWFPVGHSVRSISPSNAQFKDMAACHKCRHDWTGKKISAGDTGALLAPCSLRNGLHSQALHERFYMETPKANWPMEIKLIVSSAWLPVAMAAVWVPNHHRPPHLTKQSALFLTPKKLSPILYFSSSLSSPQSLMSGLI